MHHVFLTPKFEFSYSDSHVESHVLWENHCHARYEMIAVLEGDISIILEGRRYRLTENQVVMIPPLSYHTVTANKQGAYKRITAFFDLHAVPDVLHAEFTRHDTRPAIFESPLLKDIQACILEPQASLFLPLIESLMIPLFYDRLKTPEANADNTKSDALVLEIIDYVDKHLSRKICLDDLARHTARSKSFICHQFERKMGIPPKQYILQKKMALAQKMILEGHPTTRVAVQLGYANYGTFYRLYKKHFGTKPSRIDCT